MHIKKYDFAICAVNGVIYTFGGYSLIEKVCLKGCEKFDLQTEFWTQLPSLRRSRRQCCAEVINANQIAVFGGINKDSQSLGI
jgi:N-acetylneuraminic acid mutarotase